MSTLQLSIGYRRGVPHIRQAELAECGLACLAMILGHHGQAADIAGLRRRFPQSARGVSLERLMRMADESGLSPRAVKLPLESLPNLALPAILHWDFQHFVVLEKVRNGRALIADPAGEKRWMTFDELSPHFTGVALELRTTPNFQPGKRGDRLKVRQLWTKLSGLRRALAQTLLLTITLQVFTLASPYYMQLAIDSALPAFDKNLLTLLAMAFGMLALFNVVATWLRSFVLLAVGTSLGYALSINIVRHLLRLPIDWFSKRSVGDILSRFQSIAPIQQLLTQSAVTVLVDGIVALATLTVMFIYSPALALLAIGAFAALLLIRAITYPMQRRALQDTIVTGAKEQSFLIETLRGMQTVRLFNQETQRHALWQGRLTDSVNARVQQAKIGIWQTGATGVVAGIENVAGVWLAIAFVMEGALSVGMVFAFFAYKMQFQAKAASLVDQAIALRLIGLHLERLSDIALAPKDHGFDQLAAGAPDLTGRIELRNVGYAFAEGEPSVISGLDLDIRPGEFVAIVGPSGGGKSTLLKILLGLLRPSSGEILIDGVPLSAFGYENYRSQIGAVLQDDHLFAGSLAENIAFFDSATDWPRIVEAATAAAIHEDIVRMPMGYATLVGDMGASLSCGQRQRILLARALYRRPKLLVMDEGTSFLDEDNERAVNAAIAALGITRIVVTHRLASVAKADRVLVKTAAGGLREQTDRVPATQ